MKEKILKLRSLGKSYRYIAETLGCSKSLVNYYCTEGAKQKVLDRSKGYNNKKRDWHQKQTLYLKEFSWRYRRICGCSECNIKDPRVLQYDHIDNSDKKGCISRMISRGQSVETVKAEIRKCRILCANCHQIRTGKQQGWYLM